MMSASMTRKVLASCTCFRGGGVWPPTQNGWAVPPPEDRHTSLPKVKGRREGVADAFKEMTSDGVPKHEVALANSLGEYFSKKYSCGFEASELYIRAKKPTLNIN